MAIKPVLQISTGSNVYTTLSGTAGGDAQIWSGGGGTLLSVTPLVASLSGSQITLYDGVAPVSGGPLATSGHKIIGNIAAGPNTGLSGLTQAAAPVVFGTAFLSGLCIASRSGMVGAVVSFVPNP